jgi:hypothetical protein
VTEQKGVGCVMAEWKKRLTIKGGFTSIFSRRKSSNGWRRRRGRSYETVLRL